MAEGAPTAWGSAIGNTFDRGRVIPMARGDIIAGGTQFRPMANGDTAMMGEAGPEAVVPLVRMPSGNLGVRSGSGSGGPAFYINVQVGRGSSGDKQKDHEFGKGISEELVRQLRALVTATISEQQRPGGQLSMGASRWAY